MHADGLVDHVLGSFTDGLATGALRQLVEGAAGLGDPDEEAILQRHVAGRLRDARLQADAGLDQVHAPGPQLADLGPQGRGRRTVPHCRLPAH